MWRHLLRAGSLAILHASVQPAKAAWGLEIAGPHKFLTGFCRPRWAAAHACLSDALDIKLLMAPWTAHPAKSLQAQMFCALRMMKNAFQRCVP